MRQSASTKRTEFEIAESRVTETIDEKNSDNKAYVNVSQLFFFSASVFDHCFVHVSFPLPFKQNVKFGS